MGRLLAKYRDWLLGAGLFCAALALMAYPQESMEAARDEIGRASCRERVYVLV